MHPAIAPNVTGLPVRLATAADSPALMALVERSFRVLGARDYPVETVAAATGTLIKFDPELLEQGRVFVAEDGGEPVACAGWTDFADWLAGDLAPERRDRLAVIRSVFVAPTHAGRGLGRRLMEICHEDALAHGRRDAWLMATLTGVPLYRRLGYRTVDVQDVPLAQGGTIRGIVMRLPLEPAAAAA